jgi:hypothetical protein
MCFQPPKVEVRQGDVEFELLHGGIVEAVRKMKLDEANAKRKPFF